MRTIARFRRNRSGATAIEYGVITLMLSVAIVVALKATGSTLGTTFASLNDSLSTGGSGASTSTSPGGRTVGRPVAVSISSAATSVGP